ncbi:transposase [Paenibacillus sp. JTLBN-2024]
MPCDIILDLDSTVETVYGDQEGAAKGTNPAQAREKSYHPLLAFEGQTRLNLNAALRSGNTHSSTDSAGFLHQTFDLLGERKVKYARFDKGFGGEDFYSLWENKGIGYVGKLEMDPAIGQKGSELPLLDALCRRRLDHRRNYHDLQSNLLEKGSPRCHYSQSASV